MKKIIDWFKGLLGSGPTADTQDKEKSKGFTLIELLIVIAVIGILAAVVLVAINPIEQLARGRDSGSKSTTGQLGRALQAYYTVTGAYPTEATDWVGELESSGEIKGDPEGSVAPGDNCSSGVIDNNFCYILDTTNDEFLIFTVLESSSEENKASCDQGNTYFIYSSAAGKGGTVCMTGGDPTPNNYAGPFF